MAINRKRLEQFLARQVMVDRDEGPCSRIVLRHLVGTKVQPVGEIIVLGRTDTDAMAVELEELAITDATELGGNQNYTIRAFFGTGKGQGGNDRFAFRLCVDKEQDDEDMFGSESASPKGIIAMQMRHNEGIMRLAIMGVADTARIQARTFEAMSARLERLEQGRTQQIETMEEMISQRHTRDIETRREENTEKRKERAFEQLALLAPVVLNKLAGKKVLPEKIAGEVDQIRNLLATVSPEQLSQLSGVLSPMQLTALLSLYETVVKDQTAEKKPGNGAIVKASLV